MLNTAGNFNNSYRNILEIIIHVLNPFPLKKNKNKKQKKKKKSKRKE